MYIVTTDGIYESSPSNIASAQTNPADVGGNLFYTGFEGSIPAPFYAWGSNVSLSTTQVKTGTQSLEARFNATPYDVPSDAQIRFDLGAEYTELWFQWDYFVPVNYFHRASGAGQNNKLFRLWSGTGTTNYNNSDKVGLHYNQPYADGSSTLRTQWSNQPFPAITSVGPALKFPNTQTDLGTWFKMKLYIKAPTASQPGTFNVYIDDVLSIQNSGTVDYWPGENHTYRAGYIFGSARTGYDNETLFYIDNFSVSTTEAGLAAPTILFHRDFEGGVLGAEATSDPSGLDSQVGDASRNAFDNTHFHTGSQSIKVTTATGGVNFGGSINIPQIGQGQQAWFKQWHYYPSGSAWSETDANPTGGSNVRKFWRVGRAGSELIAHYVQMGSGKLMPSLEGSQFTNGVSETAYFNSTQSVADCKDGAYGCSSLNDGFNPNSWSPVIPRDKWFATELYVYGTTQRSDPNAPYGFNAMWWYYDDATQQNILLRGSFAATINTGTINTMFVGNIWGGNDGAPQVQSFWVDDCFAITSNPPQTCDQGYPCIGNWTP